MQADLWTLYRHMLRSRLFEEAVAVFWHRGFISGEMHLGMGEEAIAAGAVLQLRDGDAMALDHRGTPPMLMRGVEPLLILRELLGRPDGLCGGLGGHMHLFSPKHLALSSGIVGSSGPAAAGFGLAANYLRPGSVALAFFGEGAANQGMLLESFNLAVIWKLPVLFICKDNDWAITTESATVQAGDLVHRAQSFGMPAVQVDGADVEAVWEAAGEGIDRARAGEGPSFLHARCRHFESHMLGIQTARVARNPATEAGLMIPLLRSAASRSGAPLRERINSLRKFAGLARSTRKELRAKEDDPLRRTRQKLAGDESRLRQLEDAITQEIEAVIERAEPWQPAYEAVL